MYSLASASRVTGFHVYTLYLVIISSLKKQQPFRNGYCARLQGGHSSLVWSCVYSRVLNSYLVGDRHYTQERMEYEDRQSSCFHGVYNPRIPPFAVISIITGQIQ